LSRNAPDLPADGLSLDDLVAQVEARLEALRPFVREFEQLRIARDALVAGTAGVAASPRPRERRRAAPAERARRAPPRADPEA
jgi:hypothetical protein